MRRRSATDLLRGATAVALFAVASVWSVIYTDQHAEWSLWFVVVVAAAVGVAGFLARSAWILPLAILPFLIALPFGFQDEYLGSDAQHVWSIQLGVVPWYLLFAGIGVLLGRRRQASAAAPGVGPA